MVASLLDRISGIDAGRPAVADSTDRLTYGDLRASACAIGRGLAARYGRGGYLIVPAEPTVRFVSTLLGVMASGNTPIPVDPTLPAAGLAQIETRSGARGVVRPGTVDAPVVASGGTAPVSQSSMPAMIMFTSGSTGQPKGVMISHGNLASACDAMAAYLEYSRFPSAAVALPLHYSYALLSQVCCQLWIGGRVRLFKDLRNPLKFSDVVEQEHLETFCGVPSTFHALTTFHGMKSFSMPSVRIVCSAGAAMDRSRFEVVKAIFPNATFFNNYGMTEAAPRIAYIREDDPRFAEPTCGRPMAGVEVRVVDPESHAPLPDGRPGMLVVRGPNVTSGYLNDPDQTRQAFTADGFLISGDIARLDRGYIFIEGRSDDIFNSGGEKIAPLEIEDALRRIAGVDGAAVTGVPDEARGMVPVAFLTCSQPLTRKAIVEALAAQLTRVKIPARFFEVRGFPMTSNGKLQRKRLASEGEAFGAREIA